MRRSVTAILCLLTLAAGCATTSARKDIEVRMLSGSSAVVGGRTVTLEDAPGRLRAMGARDDTSVRVIVPRGLPPGALQRIGRVLASAGFTKTFFSTVRRADAALKE